MPLGANIRSFEKMPPCWVSPQYQCSPYKPWTLTREPIRQERHFRRTLILVDHTWHHFTEIDRVAAFPNTTCHSLTKIARNLSWLRFCCPLPAISAESSQRQLNDGAHSETRILLWPREQLGSPSTLTSPQWPNLRYTPQSNEASASTKERCWPVVLTWVQPNIQQRSAKD